MSGNKLPPDHHAIPDGGVPLPSIPPTPPPLPERFRDSSTKPLEKKSAAAATPATRTTAAVPASITADGGSVPTARPIPVSRPADPVKAIGTAARNDQLRQQQGNDTWDNERIAGFVPPWLISLTTHVLLLIVFGLIFFPGTKRKSLQLEATFADSIGEQLDEAVTLSQPDSLEDEQAIVFEEVDLPPVENPLASLPVLDVVPDSLETAVDAAMPSVAVALNGREAGMRSSLLKAYGGTKETEAAVKNALKWLWKQQRRTGKSKGSWSLEGPYRNGGEYENRVAATSMALLAFQGAGHTHQRGQYKKDVKLAWDWLLNQQKASGSFYSPTRAPNDRFYTHAMATIAICELLAMTKDSKLLIPASSAIQYLVESQGDEGGWRYQPKGASDLSVTGWVVMALQSARTAGISIPDETFANVGGFLDKAAVGYGDRYGYMVQTVSTRSMTAEGLLCRQYLGWGQEDQRLVSGASYLTKNPISWRDPSLYYWYYATQVLHHMEGRAWEQWNDHMRVELPKRQASVGGERGSWYHPDDRWSQVGGRLYSTCLCTFMLEVYYRHLPLYNPLFR